MLSHLIIDIFWIHLRNSCLGLNRPSFIKVYLYYFFLSLGLLIFPFQRAYSYSAQFIKFHCFFWLALTKLCLGRDVIFIGFLLGLLYLLQYNARLRVLNKATGLYLMAKNRTHSILTWCTAHIFFLFFYLIIYSYIAFQ